MRLLDRYSILDQIGSGGMATIYRATDERLNRVVCVKLLRTTLVEGSGSTSGRAVYQATYSHFLKEALALSKLSHGNTLRIYDFGYLSLDEVRAAAPKGTDEATLEQHAEKRGEKRDKRDAGGAPFHVSEYLDGGNLETHVRKRKVISAEEALGILEGISGAVAEAHGYGIIHRDIKPSNILFARVSDQLVAKLADFGIAHSDVKKSGGASGTTRTSVEGNESVSTVALFSPRWAAPEQLCGSAEGPRTDVYALGLLTTFMLGGRIFFGDEDVRKTFNDRVRGDTLVNARLAHLGFSPDVSDVLRRAMAARPEDRMATAPEFYQQLREALRVKPPSSIAPFPATPAVPPPPPVPSMAFPHEPHEPHEPAMAEAEGSGSQGGLRVADAVAERVVPYGHRRVRFIQVHERLDLSFVDRSGAPVRMRVTMLPGGAPKLNLKGLTCFVARRGQRPTPALTVDKDGAADLVSASREVLGELTWSFGQPAQGGRLFLVDGRHLLVPYSDAQQAIALMLTRGNDLVVMCRR